MGFFDFLTGGEEGQMKRHAKRVKDLNAQLEDRQLSAHWLAEQGSEEAIFGLLGRFSVSYEQRMKDADEKRYLSELLLDMGDDVVEPIRKWSLKNQNFALPLATVGTLRGDSAVVDILMEMLGRETDPFKPEKKRQILIMLAQHHDPRICERVPPCLMDFDEGIRYAAAEALLAQDTDDVIDDLGTALANRQEESNRLRVRIAEAFQQRGWVLGAHLEAVAERPPVGWRVKGDRLLPE